MKSPTPTPRGNTLGAFGNDAPEKRLPLAGGLHSSALKVTLVYGLFAILWIIFSDTWLHQLVWDHDLLKIASVYKGALFVVITSLVLWVTSRHVFGQVENACRSLTAHQQELTRLQHLHAALREVNEVILRAPSREELFSKICSTLTEKGHFVMVWVGWHEPASRRLLPVAAAGNVQGYLDQIQIYTDDRPEGRGPTGTAFRENRPFICNDLLNDTVARPWHEEMSRRNYRASAVFPIRLRSEVCGTLSVYAGEPHYFRDDEVHLLEDAAANLSFALDNAERLREQVLLSEQLQAAKDKLVGAQGVAKMGSWETDIVSLLVTWSDETHHIFGTDPAKFQPDHSKFLSMIPEPDRSRVNHAFMTSLSRHEPQEVEHRLLMPDGRTKHIIERWQVFHDETGRPVRAVGTSQDVTERKLAESEMRRTHQLLTAIVDNVPEAVFVKDREGRYQLFNEGAAKLVGKTSSQVIGHNDALLFDPENVENIRSSDQAVMLSGQPSTGEELLVVGGVQRVFLTTRAPYRDADGAVIGVVGISRDITERKELEQQLLRTQRLESIGTLASGIAHDLNNSLAPVLMATDLLRMKETDQRRLELLNMIESSAQHSADLVRQVCSFAKGFSGQYIDLQVSHLIRQIEKITNETFLKTIEVRCEVPEDLWAIHGDPGQLHQVLLNLCINARDAMPEGGVLSLKAQNVHLAEEQLPRQTDNSAGPYVLIQVRDTGCGMSQDVLERIFDPFFTTKGPGKGTGLGIFTTNSIIKAHEGFIRVESRVGARSCFSLFLPASLQSHKSEVVTSPPALPRGHGECILIVDDEPSVREAAQELLSAFGYNPVTAGGGVEALEIYKNRADEIALVLTDMMMPGMDGATLIRAILDLRADARIVAGSGIQNEAMTQQAQEAGSRHFVAKPYRAQTLLPVLRDVLNAPLAEVLPRSLEPSS